MKWFLFLLILMSVSCQTYKADFPSQRFIFKSEIICGRSQNKGYKLNLRPPLANKNFVPTGMCGYNEDRLFAGFTYKERIDLLETLLSYEGDTSLCAKPVCRYGRSNSPQPKTKRYTTQIDALYLLTLLTANAYSMEYCPYPVLVERATGKEINDDPEKLKAVFDIYRDWFEENKKTGFKKYHLPLSGNSPYEWYGAYPGFKDSLTVPVLEASPIVIGLCKD